MVYFVSKALVRPKTHYQNVEKIMIALGQSQEGYDVTSYCIPTPPVCIYPLNRFFIGLILQYK